MDTLGVGGGKIIDTAKIVADKLSLPVITVPTSAATCAATALLAVDYSDTGGFEGNYWPKYVPVATIADLDIIVKDCPVKYNIAGIVDAMAKYPEIMYNIKHSSEWKSNIMSSIACDCAKNTYELYLSKGKEVVEKMKRGIIDEDVENIIAASLFITGLISCCAFGGKQAAISHTIYSYVCNAYPNVSNKYLHGEIVGATLIYQTVINLATTSDVKELENFFKSVNQPCNLTEIGISDTDKEGILFFLQERMNITSKTEMETMVKNEQYLFET